MKIGLLLPFVLFVVLQPLNSHGAEDISSLIESIIEESEVPALAAAAVLDGRVVSVGAAGVRKQGLAV